MWESRLPLDRETGCAGDLPAALAAAFSFLATAATTGMGSDILESVMLDGAEGLDSEGAGCIDAILGELVALVRTPGRGETPVEGNTGSEPGGGGKGAMPRLFLSAAAAAAEAYFKPSPTGRIGKGAGFMLAFVLPPLGTVARGLCSVARVGNGDLSCVDDR